MLRIVYPWTGYHGSRFRRIFPLTRDPGSGRPIFDREYRYQSLTKVCIWMSCAKKKLRLKRKHFKSFPISQACNKLYCLQNTCQEGESRVLFVSLRVWQSNGPIWTIPGPCCDSRSGWKDIRLLLDRIKIWKRELKNSKNCLQCNKLMKRPEKVTQLDHEKSICWKIYCKKLLKYIINW